MRVQRLVPPFAALVASCAVIGAGKLDAQVGQFGGYGTSPYQYGAATYGGYGTSPYEYSYGTYQGDINAPYYGSGYSVANGQVGSGYRAAGRLFQPPPTPSLGPQTTVALQPLYNKITSLPGFYGSPRKVMPRTRMLPKIPRDQLLNKDGKILWPSAAPDDSTTSGTRRAAEEAVRGVVSAEKAHGSALVRDVVDAKKKLTAFAREALPIVSARDRADSEGLERFIVELEKTLQTMAVSY